MDNKLNITQWLEKNTANNLIDAHGGFYNTIINVDETSELYGILIDIPANINSCDYRVQYFTSWYGERFMRTKYNGTWNETDKYWDGWKPL